jgi:hypothetical protein
VLYIITDKFGLINLGGVEIKPHNGLKKRGQNSDYGRTTGRTGEGVDTRKKI